MDALDTDPRVAATIASEGLLAPGSKVSLRIKAGHLADRVSVAWMLIPTNDAFFALNGVPLPRGRGTVVHRSPAYDTGSEPNEERCAAIPGPVCGGEGTSAPGHIHAGIHAIGDLLAADRDWPTRWLRSAYAAFDNKHLALPSLQPCGCANHFYLQPLPPSVSSVRDRDPWCRSLGQANRTHAQARSPLSNKVPPTLTRR